MPESTPQERAGRLLVAIRHHTNDLLDLGHDVPALPDEALIILEAAAAGEPVDTARLTVALRTAETLEDKLCWAWLKATTVLFTDYANASRRLDEGRKARLAKAKENASTAQAGSAAPAGRDVPAAPARTTSGRRR